MSAGQELDEDIIDAAYAGRNNGFVGDIISGGLVEKGKIRGREFICVKDGRINPMKPFRLDGNHMCRIGAAEEAIQVLQRRCGIGIIGNPGTVAGKEVIMEQVTGYSKYHVAGDRVKVRGGWAGLEAFDISGLADMKKSGLDSTKLRSGHINFVPFQRAADN